MALSYTVMRLGTLAAFPITQLSASVEVVGPGDWNPSLRPNFRPYMFALALVCHVTAICLSFAAARLSPRAIYYKGDDLAQSMTNAYEPYLREVPAGSTAPYDAVARYLDKPPASRDAADLAREHRPGLQLRNKLRGILPGVLMLVIALLALCLYYRHGAQVAPADQTNFISVLTLTLANLGYTLALDQIIWQVSLEGLTDRGDATHPRSHGTTNFVGSTSGIMLFIKCWGYTTNSRSKWLMWMLWFQAAMVRILFAVLITEIETQKYRRDYGNEETVPLYVELLAYYGKIIGLTIGIPMTIFSITIFIAPLSTLDGWRTAKIVVGTPLQLEGRYGVKNGMAKMEQGVQPFSAGKLA